MSGQPLTTRRKYLKHLGAAAIVAGAAALGAYKYTQYLGEQTSTPPATQTGATTSTLATSTSASLQQTESTYEGDSVEKYIHGLYDRYPALAQELEKLPDVRDNKADPESIGQIARLALNHTNPEVDEAFDLMIRLSGLSPDSDYDPHPTALQLLYEMGKRNKFQQNDTLVLAIAMVNGLWSTMGTSVVPEVVYQDSSDLLVFGRETAKMQEDSGFAHNLEDYPLEAKVCWAWTGNVSQVHSSHRLTTSSLDLTNYQWNTVAVSTLRKMRELIKARRWWNADPYRTVASVEDHFVYRGPHWRYVTWGSRGSDETLTIDSELAQPFHIGNVDFEFTRYLDHGDIIGDCVDQSSVVDAFLKASGISTTFIQKWRFAPEQAHMHVIFYDPRRRTYRAYANQLNAVGILNGSLPSYSIYFPPIRRREYLRQVYLRSFGSNGLVWFYRGFSVPKDMTELQLYQQMMGVGFRSSLIKQMIRQWYE